MDEKDYFWFYLNKPTYVTFKNGETKFGKVRHHDSRYGGNKTGWFLEIANNKQEEIELISDEIEDMKPSILYNW